MPSFIPCGDLDLNIAHPHGMPTLVPSAALEQHLDWRLIPAQDDGPMGAVNASPLPPLAVHLHVHYLETLPTLLNALNACRTGCLLYTSPSPRDVEESRMPSSA